MVKLVGGIIWKLSPFFVGYPTGDLGYELPEWLLNSGPGFAVCDSWRSVNMWLTAILVVLAQAAHGLFQHGFLGWKRTALNLTADEVS
jgi:hypothetical protein